MLEGSERAKMEKRAMQGSCCMWAALGFFHGGHWLILAAKAGDPRLAYLARSRNGTLDGASKKVETMIRTLEQHVSTQAIILGSITRRNVLGYLLTDCGVITARYGQPGGR